MFTKKWMIDFYEPRLSPPCTAPPCPNPSLQSWWLIFLSFRGWHSSSLCFSPSLALKDDAQMLYKSSWLPMSVRCSMSYKAIQRDKLHETSAERLVAFWYGLGFLMLPSVLLLIAGCDTLTVSCSVLWSVISNQCLANDTVGLLLTRLARNCCWLKTDLWLEIWADHHGSPQYRNIWNSAASLWIWVEVLNCEIVVALQLKPTRNFHTLDRKTPGTLWLCVKKRYNNTPGHGWIVRNHVTIP